MADGATCDIHTLADQIYTDSIHASPDPSHARSPRPVTAGVQGCASHGLVTGRRTGRTVTYALFDNHVAMLLDEAVYHSEHLHLGIRDTPEPGTAVS
jgi:hypothetical protein